MATHGQRPTLDELAAGPIDDADLATLGRLAHLYDTLDPVPSGLVDRIQFGLTLDALEVEIAELQRATELVGVRGEPAEAQTVTFNSSSLTTMVTITNLSSESVRIDGWVVPGGGVEVELRLVGRSLTTTADADGRFVLDSVPHGLAQFVLRTPSVPARPAVVTPSIEL